MSDTLSTNDTEDIRIICIPTEAGTHFPGQCKAPAALLETGQLASKLSSDGHSVSIHDKVIFSDFLRKAAAWSPAAKVNGVRNEDNALSVMEAVQSDLETNHSSHHTSFPIILGGDCSIAPAVLSGLSKWHPPGTKIGLIYFDGDVDLTLPSETDVPGASGTLDSMTLSHLLGRAGSLPSHRRFRSPTGDPLLSASNTVLFGFDPAQPSPSQWVYLLENSFKAFTRPTVSLDPLGSTHRALSYLSAAVDVIYIHFGVNVCDSGQFPLTNYPHYQGLDAEKAFLALAEMIGWKKVRGVTVTQINPNNDVEGKMVGQVVDAVVAGLQMRREGSVGEGPLRLGKGMSF